MKIQKIRTALRASSVRMGIFCTLMVSISVSHAQNMLHPGGWHTQEDLTTIREKVGAREEPWISGWNAAQNERGPGVDFQANVQPFITDWRDLSSQGHDIYRLAMKWVATGDQRYADAGINAINAWVRTVDEFDVWGPTLTLSTSGGYFAQGAEMLPMLLMGKLVGVEMTSRPLKLGL